MVQRGQGLELVRQRQIQLGAVRVGRKLEGKFQVVERRPSLV